MENLLDDQAPHAADKRGPREKTDKERCNLIKQITRYPKHLETAIKKQNQNN
jgi:transposase